MPVISGEDFQPSRPFKNGHLATLAPYFTGTKSEVEYKRQRLSTDDGDFLDVDWSKRERSEIVCILCHGLEGSSASNYMMQFAHFLNSKGCDVAAVNYRGCSGEPNRLVTSYNSGTTGDLHMVLKSLPVSYKHIFLVGFSLGGNLILKFLGEARYPIDPRIRAAVTISTPVHLSDVSAALLRLENILYQVRFLSSLYQKIRQKHRLFPDKISLKPWWKIRNLYDFDQWYTAPLFGYKDAEDYYAQNQAIQWLDRINIPSYIVNAQNDPFLGHLCYPYEIAEDSEIVSLCAPKYGGHVGFTRTGSDRTWLLEKTWSYLNTHL